MTELKWIEVARSMIGLKEIKGPKHNNLIVRMWDTIKVSVTDDETPWCAAFVGHVLETCGFKSTRSGLARSYLNYGVKLDKPAYGCIVVFWRISRTSQSGHVGFVIGKDKFDNLIVLSANVNDCVKVAPFKTDRVLGYRWPSIYPKEERFNLPLLESDGKVSTDEA